LLHQVVTVQETERQRIARELHDVTGQSLTAIALGLRGVETTVRDNPALAVEQMRELESVGTAALSELRQLIADLRPSQLDDLGLVAALQWYLQEFEARYAIKTAFAFSGNRAQRLPAEYEIVLFRITQEALTNIAKHARASLATVRLVLGPAHICLIVEDNGSGFDVGQALAKTRIPGPHGWGLLGIQERALLVGGRCEITSQPGQGTCIRIAVPLGSQGRGKFTDGNAESAEVTAQPGLPQAAKEDDSAPEGPSDQPFRLQTG
jgi:two-component system sensor histidine kinase UhpB